MRPPVARKASSTIAFSCAARLRDSASRLSIAGFVDSQLRLDHGRADVCPPPALALVRRWRRRPGAVHWTHRRIDRRRAWTHRRRQALREGLSRWVGGRRIRGLCRPIAAAPRLRAASALGATGLHLTPYPRCTRTASVCRGLLSLLLSRSTGTGAVMRACRPPRLH